MEWNRRVASALVAGLVALLVPCGARAETGAASECRESRLPPRSDWSSEDGVLRLNRDFDVDGDGRPDRLAAEDSFGTGFGLTSVTLVLVSGERLAADFDYSFSSLLQPSSVPRALLEARHRQALEWIEEALFGTICPGPDPSLAWLLDPQKRLRWIPGPPVLPGSYALRVPAAEAPGSGEAAGPPGEQWLWYGGHNHAYRLGKGPVEPVLLAKEGLRVLLGTPHGVILTDPARSQHAWIYVSQAQHKLRWPSVLKARIKGRTAIVTLSQGDGYLVQSGTREVRVDLETGELPRE